MQAPQALDDVAPDLKYKVMPLRRASAEHALHATSQQVHHEHVARPAEDRLPRVVMKDDATPLAAHCSQDLRLQRDPRAFVRWRVERDHLDRDVAVLLGAAAVDLSKLALAQNVGIVDAGEGVVTRERMGGAGAHLVRVEG